MPSTFKRVNKFLAANILNIYEKKGFPIFQKEKRGKY